MADKPKAQVAAPQDKQPEPTVEVVSEILSAQRPATPPIVRDGHKGEAVVVEVEAVEEKMVEVIPRMTLSGIRIGPHWISVVQGQKTKVSKGVEKHLREKGII